MGKLTKLHCKCVLADTCGCDHKRTVTLFVIYHNIYLIANGLQHDNMEYKCELGQEEPYSQKLECRDKRWSNAE